MADKSRAELEYELKCAYEAKLSAEDRLSGSRLGPTTHQLHEAEMAYQELQAEYEYAVAAKGAAQSELDEALNSVDDVNTLNEEIAENDKLITSLREQIDQNTSAIGSIREHIEGLKSEYDICMEDLEITRQNNEHTGLIERRLHVIESQFNGVVDELRSLEDNNDVLATQLSEAHDARESAEHILEDVEGRFNVVTNLEAQIANLEGIIEDKRSALETHFDLIEELKEDVEVVTSDLDADSDLVAEQAALIDSLNEQLESLKDPVAERNENLDTLLARLAEATCHEDIYALGESFNKLGFTIQTTIGGRAVLCKVQDGKALTETVLEDFVFIGDPGNLYEHFTDGTVDKITDFVKNNVGSTCQCESKEPVMVVNEDKQLAVDILAEAAPNWGVSQGFAATEPGKTCPRCSEQALVAARGSYNCTRCGWRGGSPTPGQA
jgi:archaellum component FlaC